MWVIRITADIGKQKNKSGGFQTKNKKFNKLPEYKNSDFEILKNAFGNLKSRLRNFTP